VRVLGESVLEVFGIEIDEIEAIGSVMPQKGEPYVTNTYRERRELASCTQSPNDWYVGGGLIEQVYHKTMCLDGDPLAYMPKKPQKSSGRFKMKKKNVSQVTQALLNKLYGEIGCIKDGRLLVAIQSILYLLSIVPEKRFPMDLDARMLVRSIYYDIQVATVGRRFFRTRKGYIGLGPENMEVRDTVCVLEGGTTPFLLRYSRVELVSGVDYEGRDGPRACHKLVGDCYVQTGVNLKEHNYGEAIAERLYLV